MLETIFSATGALAMLGWLALVFPPHVDWAVKVLARLVIPALIGLVYLWLMASNAALAPDGGNFSSLEGVKTLFTVDGLLLGGWVHYLAFDLFVGSWEVEDARRNRVPHLLVIPCLFATLMAGPAGLVLYLLLRMGARALRDPEAAA